jgi:uncharacterized protein YcbX
MKISDIIHYPVKSFAGNHLSTCEVHERGLKDDRRYMLVDNDGTFVSQRKYPLLSQIEVGITESNIILRDRRTNESINHQLEFELKKTDVKIWRSNTTSHQFLYKELDEWISDRMGTSLRFVYMDESDHRSMNPEYAKENEIVSFADGYPILICNAASLAILNSKLDSPITMSHFRPNIVLDHHTAWEEDNWKRLKIGEVILRIPKPCARCTVINIDPNTGEKNKNVLLTLSKARLSEEKILFGINAIIEKTGIIGLDDKVEIVE